MGKKVTVIVEGREYVVEVGDLNETPIRATVNQRTYHVEVPQRDTPSTQQSGASETPSPASQTAAPRSPVKDATITAPIPGNIIDVKVTVGDNVKAGDVVFILEAMKMKNMIHSNVTGIIASVNVQAGQAVDYGEILATFQ